MMGITWAYAFVVISLGFSAPPTIPAADLYAAIALDLDGNGIHTSNVHYDPVSFDLNADGVPEEVGWLAPATADAFLWIDLNGDGVPNNGIELFGHRGTPPRGQTTYSGWEALAAYDDNQDGKINADDAVWSRLLLWNDRDHSGTLSPGERQAVSSSRVVGISLDHTDGMNWWWDENRNEHSYRAAYWTRSGRNYTRHVIESIAFDVLENGTD